MHLNSAVPTVQVVVMCAMQYLIAFSADIAITLLEAEPFNDAPFPQEELLNV